MSSHLDKDFFLADITGYNSSPDYGRKKVVKKIGERGFARPDVWVCADQNPTPKHLRSPGYKVKRVIKVEDYVNEN